MKPLELLPYICYGRKKDSVMDSVTDCYAIQEQSPSISKEVIKLFLEHIKGSIQWEISEETTKYADCFLIWRVNHSGFLFTKLSDGGCDSFNRNHSMQMDAVYLTNEQVPNTADNEQVSNAADHQALFFASLCFSSVWEDWEKSKRLQPVDESELKVKEIAQKLLEFFSETASSVHSLFFAFHEHFVSFRVDWIVHNDKDLLQIKSSSVKTEPVHVIVSSPENQLPSKSPLIKKFIIIVVVLILGIAMSLLAWHTSYHSLHIKYDETKTLLENEKEKIQKKDLEIDELKKENENLKKGNENLKKGNENLKKENENLKKENENLENQLQDSRKNADESLKKENESLNSENKKLNEKVNQIRKYVNQISKDVENTINILKD